MSPHETNWLETLRENELDFVLERYRSVLLGKELLEIGAGSGFQLRRLRQHCAYCVGVDVPGGMQRALGVDQVLLYDGVRLPFRDASFDVIYSSNVLEHVGDLSALLSDCRRVLRPGGCAIHILPTHWWKIWTTLTHWPSLPRRFYRRIRGPGTDGGKEGRKLLLNNEHSMRTTTQLVNVLFPPRHGELGNRISEFLHFRPSRWRREFWQAHWQVVDEYPVGIAYSGNSLLEGSMSIPARRKLALLFGSACVSFVVK